MASYVRFIETARQSQRLSYRPIHLSTTAFRQDNLADCLTEFWIGKTISQIVLPRFKTARQSYILSYPPPFSSSSLTISYTRTYTHTHSPFSSFDRKTCWFRVSFSSFMFKNLLVWFLSFKTTETLPNFCQTLPRFRLISTEIDRFRDLI